MGFPEVAINGYRLNALNAVDPMMLSQEEFLPGEFKKLWFVMWVARLPCYP